MEIINKISLLYNKRARIIRFLIILTIALWVNFYLIPDLKIPSDNLQKIESNNITYVGLGVFDLTQEDLSSGNFDAIFWKIIYLGGGRDKICFEKTNFTNNQTLSVRYNNGELFNVTRKKCINIPDEADKITFQLSYGFTFTLPTNLPSQGEVNKSECLPGTIEEVNDTFGYCYTQRGIDNAVTWVFYPNGEVYLEPNLFHKVIKFLFIFFSTGAILWGFSRTFYLIKYGWDKK
jgi:hypothetical protein